MTDGKVKTIKPAAAMSPEKAADVAALRQVIEDYITGKVRGICVIWSDAEGMPDGSDLLGEIDSGYLYVELDTLKEAIRRGLSGEDYEE